MDETELFAHYEKIYFSEQQRKEQIFSRLNIPLVVIVALVGFYAVLIGVDYKKLPTFFAFSSAWVGICSVILLLRGIYCFCDALLGLEDQALPTPNGLEKWRQELQLYYVNDSDCDRLVAESVKRALYADYMNCGSLMSVNNDLKASSLYLCNVTLICATAFAFIAYAFAKLPTI